MKIEYELSRNIRFKKTNDDGDVEYIEFTPENNNNILGLISEYVVKNGTGENNYVDIPKREFREFYKGEDNLAALIYEEHIERDYFDYANNKPFGYRFSVGLIDKLKLKTFDIEEKDIIKNNSTHIYPNIKKLDKSTLNRIESDFNSVEFFGDFVDYEHDEWGNFVDVETWLKNNFIFSKWKLGHKTYNWNPRNLSSSFTMLSQKARMDNIRLSGEQLAKFEIDTPHPLLLCLYCLKINPSIINDYDFKEFSKSVLNGRIYSTIQSGLNSVRDCNKEGSYDYDRYGVPKNCDFSTRKISTNETKKLFKIFLNDTNSSVEDLSSDISDTDLNTYMKMKYTTVYDVVEQFGDNLYEKLEIIKTELLLKIIDKLYEIPDIKILMSNNSIYVSESYEDKVSIIWDTYIGVITSKLPREAPYNKNLDLTIGNELFER